MKTLQNSWILVLALACNGALVAQTTLATITGQVTDAIGAIVPGVKIEVTNTDTNYKYTATSNDAGQYTVTGMLNGPYTFRASASGSAPFVVENILIAGRDMRRIDVALQLGTVQNTIEVSSRGSLIETETARVSDVKEHDVIWIAPLFLHRTADVIQMAPMATYNGNYGG
jgi:Carboxypeptidase regulatory-like domain